MFQQIKRREEIILNWKYENTRRFDQNSLLNLQNSREIKFSNQQGTVFFLEKPTALERLLRVSSDLGTWDLCLVEGYYGRNIPNIVVDSQDVNELTLANSEEETFVQIIKIS